MQTNKMFPESCPNCERDFHDAAALTMVFEQRREFSGDLDKSGMLVGYSHLRITRNSMPHRPKLIEESLLYVGCAGCGFTIAVPHDEFDGDHHVADVSTLESEHNKE